MESISHQGLPVLIGTGDGRSARSPNIPSMGDEKLSDSDSELLSSKMSRKVSSNSLSGFGVGLLTLGISPEWSAIPSMHSDASGGGVTKQVLRILVLLGQLFPKISLSGN